MLRLYTFQPSPNALKVRFALAELGVPYEPVEVNLLRGEHQNEAFSALNPHRKVPVLVDGALVLRESAAILAYLGDARGGALWPAAPAARAEALQWLFFDAANFGYAGRLWWADVLTPRTGRTGPLAGPALVEQIATDVGRALSVLEAHLSSRQYLLGDDFSLADCGVGVMVNLLRGTRVDTPDKLPAVTAYRERIRARPGWGAAGGAAIEVP
ncbi:glutathione S-transferase family protein [Polyangium aurulentum]|uniref:glutathione S-transferase family protein n=1 Tax=Polyangium aurulentum TaxID=2567896 RepID=UPI00146F45FF|nr:glutathione S-transferase family protein [Polyangium aurulentum]UQA57199.1 glutathione S-transferase family protein [Polyangium aurulentum]